MTGIPEITFTLVELETSIRELVANSPKTVYSQAPQQVCLYTQGKAGCGEGCLIGQGISKVQPNLIPFLEKCDENVINGDATIPVSQILVQLGFGGTFNWFQAVQGKQDRGFTWQTAVNEADYFRNM